MKFNAFVPELSVSNIERSKHFYINILCFQLQYERNEDKFAFISLGQAQLMLAEINGHWETAALQVPFGRGIIFQIIVDNIDEMLMTLQKHNVQLFRGPFTSEYAVQDRIVTEKEFLVQDPDGYLLRFSQEL